MTPDQQARVKLEAMLEQLNITASVHSIRTLDGVTVQFGRGAARADTSLPPGSLDDWEPGDPVPDFLRERLRAVDRELAGSTS